MNNSINQIDDQRFNQMDNDSEFFEFTLWTQKKKKYHHLAQNNYQKKKHKYQSLSHACFLLRLHLTISITHPDRPPIKQPTTSSAIIFQHKLRIHSAHSK